MKTPRILCFYVTALLVFEIATPSHAAPREPQARPAQFSQPATGEKVSIRLITPFGTINNRSRQILSRLASPGDGTTRTVLLHPRLLLMLQRVTDQFGGRVIEIVSGYRLDDTGHSDSHGQGRAIDFRVVGVKNKKVYEFVKSLPNCGTGFYPKTSFVHLDVREETATWIDYFHKGGDCRIARSKENYSGKPVSFLSVWNDQKAELQLVTEGGAINNRSRRILSQLANSRAKTSRTVLLHPRLILMLQKVADRFPDKRIEIISGHRLAEKGWHSYHNFGRAVDFRVAGVDRKELYAFLRTLPKCGTGFYPNSVFIHLDVRDKSTTWTDYSGVGEKSQYKKSGKRK